MSKLGFRKLSILVTGNFLIELTFLSQMNTFFQKSESSLEVWKVKVEFSDKPIHNILEL